ncbi:Gamma-aminobutyric acid type B receptor subunit 2 [Phytophthora ramorum]|nr:Gamma-aminobutyric acid type B receptor subunit 2 [Phytophthora ramorum]
MVWLLFLFAVTSVGCCTQADAAGTYPLGPNRFLGTCLDSAWVEKMETERGVSSQDRDTQGRLVHPFLQTALQYPRHRVDDPRTEASTAYTDECMTKSQRFFGANQPSDGSSRGEVNGTLVIDVGDWATHILVSMVLAIVAEEVSGYKVSLNYGCPTAEITMRMSSARTGICSPTHLNPETWTSSSMAKLRVYFNESYPAGGVGYFGGTGLYTTHQFALEGASATPPYYPGFWMDYKLTDTLINKLSVVRFKANPKYYPPPKTICADNQLGCKDDCSKSEACTKRESEGKECLVIAMMYPEYDKAYFQAVVSNLGIAAYFCFIGYDGVDAYATEAESTDKPVIFIHWEPDLFHVKNKGKFDRIFLPRTDPERVKLATGDYGEHGYGGKTDNGVDVDYPSQMVAKFAASVVKDFPAGALFSQLTISNLELNNLMSEYIDASANDPDEWSPYFHAACNWAKTNYDTWSEWMDRLPVCTLETHIVSQVTGCGNDSSRREIRFSWKSPNPGNTSLPYECDGGVSSLPATFATSRSCDWIFDNHRIWSGWMDEKPECDLSFYDYNVSDCDSDALRTVQYFWKLPQESNSDYSGECEGGDKLPKTIQIDCEYMPTSSPSFAGMIVFAAIVAVLLAVAIVVVFKQRNAPIIRRSQYEMLLLMLFGGFFTTGAAIAYAGRPTKFLCGVRPVLICMGFTTIFGSLVIKSLRVYRVFLRSAMKRVKVTLFRILKILSIFYIGDIIIFIAWFGADFPEPTITTKDATEFRGTVDRISCSSSSFIFTALLIFWKAILLMLGLYLSFLIRNVSVEFQESPWIFGSVVVVVVGCLVVMPMSYLVDMRASTYYVFLACVLIICTILIMCLMLVPKMFRLKEETSSSASSTSMANSAKSRNSLVPAKPIASNLTNLTETDDVPRDEARKSSQKYQVKPLGGNTTNNSNSVMGDEGVSTTDQRN